MIWFVLAVLFLIVGAIALAAGIKTGNTKNESYDSRNKGAARGAKYAGIGMLLAAGLFLFLSMLYRQDVGEALVITTPGGEIAGIDTDAGFGLKAPWNGVDVYDTRNQVISMIGDGTGENVAGAAITGQTKDGTSATIDLTIRYSINPSSVADIYRGYRTQENLVSKALVNDVRSIIRNETVAFPTTTMRQERGKLSTNIQKSLDEKWKALGVIVDSVDLRGIVYPPEIEDSLKQVQTATNNVDRAKAELETARVEAEKVKTEAQASSDADQIIRCGATSTTVKETINGKEVNAIKVIPVPSDKCQNRLNQQVLTAKYIEMLRQAAASGNTIYVIPPDTNSLLNLGGPNNSTGNGMPTTAPAPAGTASAAPAASAPAQ